MHKRPCDLVERSIALLLEVRVELQSRPEISWPSQLDDAIELLQKAKHSAPPDQHLLKEALKLIGAALAAFPAIARLIRSLSED